MTTLNDFAKGFYTLLILTPLFWIIPTLVEGLQHYVEVQLGMFTVGDSVEAGKETVIRLAFGFLKVLSIIIPSMLILKLAAQGWDKRNIFPLTTVEKLTLLILALLVLASLIFVTYYVPNNSAFLIGQLEIPSELAPFIPVFILLVPMLIFRNQLLKGFLKFCGISIEGKLSSKSYLFELFYILFPAVLLAGPMVLHYQLNSWAVGTKGGELFALLAADSLLVGFMTLLMGLSLRLAVTSVYSKELNQS